MTQSKRRDFLKNAALTLGAVAGTAALTSQTPAQSTTGKHKVIGINTSHRAGMTCAVSIKIVLDSIRESNPNLETELIELAGIDFSQAVVGTDQPKDALDDVLAKISSPECIGIVIASPVYFGLPSGRCVSLISRLMPIKKVWGLKNKVFGAVAVGAGRNGGQETILHALANSMLTQQMILAVDAAPTSHWGATLWNQNHSIEQDEFGKATAVNLGKRIAELVKFVQ